MNKPFEEKMQRLVSEGHAQRFSRVSVIRNSRITGSNFAWPRQEPGFIHCSRRSLLDLRSLGETEGEGGHPAPRGIPAEARTSNRDNRIVRFERCTP